MKLNAFCGIVDTNGISILLLRYSYLRIVRGYSDSKEEDVIQTSSYRICRPFKAIVLHNLQLPWISRARKSYIYNFYPISRRPLSSSNSFIYLSDNVDRRDPKKYFECRLPVLDLILQSKFFLTFIVYSVF